MLLRPELDETGKRLLGVADYLEEHGWCQGRMFHGERVCVFGALYNLYPETFNAGTIDNFGKLPEMRRLMKALGKDHHTLTKQVVSVVTSWNDAVGQSKEKIIETLREAAYNTEFTNVSTT